MCCTCLFHTTCLQSDTAQATVTRPAPLPAHAAAPLPPSSVAATDAREVGPAVPFRVDQLASDPSLEVMRGKGGRRGCSEALASMGVVSDQRARIQRALAGVHPRPTCSASERIVVAQARATQRVRAVEVEITPGTLLVVHERSLSLGAAVVSAPVGFSGGRGGTGASTHDRPDDDLVVEDEHLPVTHRRRAVVLRVDRDLPSALVAAQLDPSLASAIADAVASRAGELVMPRPGSSVRLVIDETRVSGEVDDSDDLVAIELQAGADRPQLRLYHLERQRERSGPGSPSIRAFECTSPQSTAPG